MSKAESESVLARKLALAQDVRAGSARSVLRAMRLALARVAAETTGLTMSVIGATQSRKVQDDLADGLAPERLFVLLAAEDGRLGAASLDSACVGAVIQQQTMGHVSGDGAGSRRFTDTDAAMVTPLLDAFLPRALELCDAPADRECLSGFRFVARMPDLRKLTLSLEAAAYRQFDLTVEISGGRMQGHITLILPDGGAVATPETVSREAGQEPALGEALDVIRAELTAVISRIRLPLSAIASMRPGDVLPLRSASLEHTEVLGIDGGQVSMARLGRSGGMLAVRLNEKLPEPDILDAAAGRQASAGDGPPQTSGNAPGAHLPAVQDIVTNRGGTAGEIGYGELEPLDLSPDQAAAEISALAGIDESGADTER